MITCKNLNNWKTWGRTSNQIFSLCHLIGHAKKHNLEYMIPEWKYSKYFKGPFNENNNLPELPAYKEPHFHYAEKEPIDNVDFEGYWQSYKYFEYCKKEILDMFTFKPEIILNVRAFLIKHAQSRYKIGVHIRRTDYVTTMSHYYHNLTIEWYLDIINKFDPTCHVFIVSDDIQWCQNSVLNVLHNITFCGFDEIKDLCILSECDTVIMANSSFSWFGAYLGKQHKQVYAPKLWFQDVAKHDTKDLLPENWIKI